MHVRWSTEAALSLVRGARYDQHSAWRLVSYLTGGYDL